MPEASRPIRLLPDHVINQIAAGEVIERPASVVKELVENSLDAGAVKVVVDVHDGGLRAIRISDDGCGIAAADLPNAVIRHCTSKLVDARDLAVIGTLGFRGEALASIAAVARVEVCSGVAGATSAHRLCVAPGAAAQLKPAAHPVGTTVEVSELFFNTPPRRRFLKRPRTEFLLIQQMLRQIAFTRPELDLELRHDGKRVFRIVPAAGVSAATRIGALLGKAFVQTAVAIDESFVGVRIAGWLGLPDAARSQRDQQYLSVNGRMITDRRLGHALRLAYEDAIAPGRYPCYALALQLPLDQVDVNVHPCKSEVRFQDPRSVHDAMYAAACRAFRSGEVPATSDSVKQQTIAEPPVKEYWPGYTRRAMPVASANPRVAATATSRIIGRRWIVSLQAERVILIDGRSLVRALARRLLTRARGETGLRRRPLLIPVPLPSGHPAYGHVEPLRTLGFEVRRTGSHDLELHTCPVGMPEFDGAVFVTALQQSLAENVRDTELAEALSQAVAIAWTPPRDSAAITSLLDAVEADKLESGTRPADQIILDERAIEELFVDPGAHVGR